MLHRMGDVDIGRIGRKDQLKGLTETHGSQVKYPALLNSTFRQ